jgi:hypothetical protein
LKAKVSRRLGQLSVATLLAVLPAFQAVAPATDLVTKVTHFTHEWHTNRIELLSYHAQARAAHAPYLASLWLTKDPAHVEQAVRLKDQLDAIQRQVEALPDGQITRQLPMIGITRLRVPRAMSLVPSTTAFAVTVANMAFTSRTYISPAGLEPLGAITNFASNESGYATSFGGALDIQWDLRLGTPTWGNDTLGYAQEWELLCNYGNCIWKVPDYSLQLYLEACNARYHTRLWEGPAQADHIFTVGDAHHDNCQHTCMDFTASARSNFSMSILPWTGRSETTNGDAFTTNPPCNYPVDGITAISWMTA